MARNAWDDEESLIEGRKYRSGGASTRNGGHQYFFPSSMAGRIAYAFLVVMLCYSGYVVQSVKSQLDATVVEDSALKNELDHLAEKINMMKSKAEEEHMGNEQERNKLLKESQQKDQSLGKCQSELESSLSSIKELESQLDSNAEDRKALTQCKSDLTDSTQSVKGLRFQVSKLEDEGKRLRDQIKDLNKPAKQASAEVGNDNAVKMTTTTTTTVVYDKDASQVVDGGEGRKRNDTNYQIAPPAKNVGRIGEKGDDLSVHEVLQPPVKKKSEKDAPEIVAAVKEPILGRDDRARENMDKLSDFGAPMSSDIHRFDATS